MFNVLDTVVTIPVVAFGQDHQIDDQVTSQLTERMLHHGITVLTMNGNTGEFYSLSSQERRTAVQLGAQFADRAEVVAGIGLDVDTAVEDGKYAVQQGCQHLMIHHPPHPFVSPEGWLNYNHAICRSFPEASIVPYVKSPHIPAESVLRLLELCPNISAVKYAVEDPHAYSTLVAKSPRHITWICGVAEKWAPTFWATTGVAAFTSGLANVSPRLSMDLFHALKDKDVATIQRLWNLARPFEELRSVRASENNVSVVKEALAQLGLSSNTVRPPISAVDATTAEAIEVALDDLKAADYLEGEN